MISHMWDIKKQRNKQKQAHRYKELISGCQRWGMEGGEMGEGGQQ